MTNTELQVKHTPAPWTPFILDMTLAEIPAYIAKCISASSNSDFYFVAGRDERGDVDIAHVGNGPRAAENARLIAAAPETAAERDKLKESNAELLEALQWYVANDDVILEMPGNEFYADGYCKAKTVIAKALGGRL